MHASYNQVRYYILGTPLSLHLSLMLPYFSYNWLKYKGNQRQPYIGVMLNSLATKLQRSLQLVAMVVCTQELPTIIVILYSLDKLHVP
jgi:hypothetical protein